MTEATVADDTAPVPEAVPPLFVACFWRDGIGDLNVTANGLAGNRELIATAQVMEMRARQMVEYEGAELPQGARLTVQLGPTLLQPDDVLAYCEFVSGWPFLDTLRCTPAAPSHLWEAAMVLRMMCGRKLEQNFRAQDAMQQASAQQAEQLRRSILRRPQ